MASAFLRTVARADTGRYYHGSPRISDTMLFHPTSNLTHVPSIVPLAVLVDQMRDFLHVGKRAATDGLSKPLGHYQQRSRNGSLMKQLSATYPSSDTMECLPTIRT